MSPKSLFVILLAGGLLLAGCGKPQTEWRVTMGPVGFCGMGIETERHAERAMLESAASTLTSFMDNEQFWTGYVNADPSLPPLSLIERRIKPRKIVNDGLVVLTLRFITPAQIDDGAARARIERAVQNYVKDMRRQEGQRAIADLRSRQVAAAEKTDATSIELARQLEQRITEVQAQMDNSAHVVPIRLTITGA